MAKVPGTYSIHKHPREELFFVEYDSKLVGRTEGVYKTLPAARKKMDNLLKTKYR